MKEIVNIPAAGIQPRGEIKIELFDSESGERQRVEKRKNYVNSKVLKDVSENFLRHIIYQRLPLSEPNGLLPVRMLNAVYLTDSGEVSDEIADFLIKGKLVGYGYMDRAATGLQRGAWNSNESIIRNDYLKLVFDFSTSQGNGVFQSIYTLLMGQDSQDSPAHHPIAEFSIPTNAQFFCENNGFLYWYDSGNIVYRIAINELKIDATYNIATTPEAFPVPNMSARQFVVKGTELYIVGQSGNAGNVIKTTLSATAGTWAVAKTLGFDAYGIAYEPNEQRFYVENYTTKNVHVYNSSWVELEVYAVPIFRAGYLTGVVKDGSKVALLFGSTFFYPETGRTHIGYGAVGPAYAFTAATFTNKYLIGRANARLFRAYTKQQFFSRALLEQPVTKTAQQNMKITYEFTLPPLDLTT